MARLHPAHPDRSTLAEETAAEAATRAAVGAPAAGLPTEPGTTAPEHNSGLPPSGPGVAAFFDLDNTLIQGASLFYLARGAAARGLLTRGAIARFAWQQLRFRLGGEHPGQVHQARTAALALVAGRRTEALAALGEGVFDACLARRIWPGSHALARAHLAAGERVWLVTAAPLEVAELIARRLGLTGALGTVAETADGVYTGRLAGDLLHGAAKAQAIQTLAAREGLDLAACAAYSDSAHDLPMLTVVGHPCAINPDGELYRYATAHGWPVHDYRRGRRVLRLGLPAAAGLGALTGAVAAGTSLRRRLAV